MANDTNMDIRKNPNATVPVFDFMLPASEVQITAEMGETGTLMVPVEIVAKSDTAFTFRKIGKVTAEGDFKPESVGSMRKKIGVVEDLEEPINKSED